ncbi:Transcriptional regulator, Cro/CI family [Leucobacter sp. 7(1)]|uniref:helix-turn-helix domain-containing protein n=1 Tax=Leucobacter sp. 7(1) TaxID=1255613 RepID=UPI00097EEBB4|nr:helix-turn-helix domain-containing protein [Leucobacter sp. 7(1)]SJN08105.1 Transcriptional regulator, Cro/CI family [Leucobacter sp. 7(1)]
MTPVELAGENDHLVECRLDELLVRRDMTLAELARRVDMSVVNLSILKNNRARAIRFTTLSALCRELECTPGELFSIRST